MALTTNKQDRKERPIARGVLDYFPDAIAEVAHVSYVGNQQHNPGEEMHWDKSKSPDHADCIARHLIERGTLDEDGMRHSAKVAWRALAMLQIEIEQASGSAPAPDRLVVQGFEEQEAQVVTANAAPKPVGVKRSLILTQLLDMGCVYKVAEQIVGGITFGVGPARPSIHAPWVYIAGPMRGIDQDNFPAFDAARDKLQGQGFNVISPADIDRAAGDRETGTQADFVYRDFFAVYWIARHGNPKNGIAYLPGWEKSTGAAGEFGIARWLGLKAYQPNGLELKWTKFQSHDLTMRVFHYLGGQE